MKSIVLILETSLVLGSPSVTFQSLFSLSLMKLLAKKIFDKMEFMLLIRFVYKV